MYLPLGMNDAADASVWGQAAMHVTCEACGQQFVYVHEAVGRAQSERKHLLQTDSELNATVRAAADWALHKRLASTSLVACPKCGWFQADMIRDSRWRLLMKASAYSGFVAVLGAYAVLRWASAIGDLVLPLSMTSLLVLSIAVAVLAWWFTYNPNRGYPYQGKARASRSTALTLADYEAKQARQAQIIEEARPIYAPPPPEHNPDDDPPENLDWLPREVR